jgi:hypothetical protein
MRNALTAMCLLTFTQFAIAQSESPGANTDFLTVRVSEDGVCKSCVYDLVRVPINA